MRIPNYSRQLPVIVVLTAFLALCPHLTGCQQGSEQNAESAETTTGGSDSAAVQQVLSQIQNTLSGASKDAISALGPHAANLTSLSTEEVQKLFRWNYKVLQLPHSSSERSMEEALNELGAENWECFSIISVSDALRITCRKRPISALQYLKYIPGI